MRGEPRSGWGITAVHWEREEFFLEYGPGVSAEPAQRAVVQAFASGWVPSLKPRGYRAEMAVSAFLGRLWLGTERYEGQLYLVIIIGSRALVVLPPFKRVMVRIRAGAVPARRWCCQDGDCVVCVRREVGAQASLEPWDYWKCGAGDVVVIAERRDQWPAWLAAHPDLDAPTAWRVRTGDCVVWVGMRPNPSGHPVVLDLHRCQTGGVIVRQLAELGTDVDALVTP